jgi:hypothetical protein
MNAESFYSSHSPMSSPGRFTSMIAALPNSLAPLVKTIHGIYIHFNVGEQYQVEHPTTRLGEVNLRFAEEMFARIFQLDPSPLDIPRPPEKHLISYCGSASLLLCALLRTKGIPCRKRVGFVPHILPDLAPATTRSWKSGMEIPNPGGSPTRTWTR